MSNGKDKPPRRDMVLCFSYKYFHDSNYLTVKCPMVKTNFLEGTWFYAFDTNLFTIGIILPSNV